MVLKLKKALDNLYTFSNRSIELISLIFTGLLLICSFACTCYALDMETQLVLTKWDSPLWNTFGIALFLFVLGVFVRLANNKPAFAKKLLLGATTLWILGIGAILIVFSKTVPAADAYSVYDIARMLANGDTSVIHPTDSYLSYYPQQIGLVAFYEPLIRLWNLLPVDLHAYHFLKILYVFLGVIIFYFQYQIIHLFFKNDRIDIIFMLLSGANLPFLMYTSFVYGEIPSFAALSVGIYCFLKMISTLSELSGLSKMGNQRVVLNGIFALVFLTISVQLRKNSLIVIIAVVLVSLLLWCKKRKPIFLLFAVLCAICAVSILPLIQKSYELRADNTLQSGVTATSYFAMGMQESSRANGWYNGFNFNTYQQSGMSTELTNEISRTAIDERLTYFSENPAYAADFYLGKFLSQWADGTYACRQATLATFGGRHAFFNELYAGKYSESFIAYCNVFQNILYLGAFLFCVGMCKKKIRPKMNGLPLYLGMICVFGGFLFHMIWEANSRYIFLYGMMLVPYAAAGIEWGLSVINKVLTNQVHSHSSGTIWRKRDSRSSNCS